MSVQQHPSEGQTLEVEWRPAWRRLARGWLRRLLRGVEVGELLVELPNGKRVTLAGAHPGPQARMVIHAWRCLWRLVSRSDLGLAESYMAGEWSTVDLRAFLNFACRNSAIEQSIPVRPRRLLTKLGHSFRRNTRRGSRRNIAAHYDLGNAFYADWLDPGMTYSSALYAAPDLTLEEAQNAKLDRAIDLLDLSGGEAVLEIGCGWGSLAERIVDRPVAALTGLTLSKEQLAYARGRLQEHRHSAKADLRLQDYRDVRGVFDRIVSIEMLEAVGQAYWSVFFDKLRACLRPGGIAVLQVITIDDIYFESYRKRPDFIQKYIFPGGMLPTKQIIEHQLVQAGLRLVDTEFFGHSYARTLAEWQKRFQKAWPRIAGLGFDARFKRMWEYYLAYCEAGFEAGAIDVGLYKIAHAT